jgi:hypothetical protein
MKIIGIFVVSGVLALAAVPASAKSASAPQNDSERITNTLAGPPPTPNKAATTQPSKKELKKAKVKPKPPLNDPN